MSFNIFDYNDNVRYCEYVYKKNEEYKLDLDTSSLIQYVANRYVDKIIEKKGFIDENMVYEDDETLLEVVAQARKKIESVVNRKSTIQPELPDYFETLNSYNKEKYMERIYDEGEFFINQKLREEKLANKNGNYSYNESYNDYGLDENLYDEENSNDFFGTRKR